MLTISKPLSAGQAAAYHASEFTNAEQSYYSQSGQLSGEWQGRLAAAWGLSGEVTAEQYTRLAQGRHPETGVQLVRFQPSRGKGNGSGPEAATMQHRAGWDATFSAPKSVSLTALVGGDERVRQAHRESVRVAVDEVEKYVQARLGGNVPAETTRQWVAAKFEHDSSRPVNGYAAPQLHTHVVFFNLTETAKGKARAIQPQELYRSQQYGTAVYQSELGWRLKALGYEIAAGKNGAPEIQGYTREYLEASSPRSQQIREHLAEQGRQGAGAAQIAAHRTREGKQALSQEETLRRHRELAETFGNQAERVVMAAKGRARTLDRDPHQRTAQSAVTFARDRNLEREAVVDQRALLRDALRRSMGQATFAEVAGHFTERVRSGGFLEVRASGPSRSYTTPEMVALERDNLARMQAGQNRYPVLAAQPVECAQLSRSQREAVETILASRDQIVGLQGAAGAGKTTSLAAIREAAERAGYQVAGCAPTSRAAQQLEQAGIRATTLQHYLAKGEQAGMGPPHLYFVDESSLASTKQVHQFFARLREADRVVLVGDIRQHQAVEAGKPYQQLQEAGMRTARLEEIVRQKEAELKGAVEQLAHGQVRQAIDQLDRQGRVHEVADPDRRLDVMASQYAAHPAGTLVISPDNRSREELNRRIHAELQRGGQVGQREYTAQVLVARQEMTGVDRQWAAQYEPADVVRYSRGSRAAGIEAGEYAKVESFDRERNLLTVERQNGQRVSYDPRRLQGVTVYRLSARAFSEGDRVQFTAPDRERNIANRELGSVVRLDEQGNVQIQLDSGKEVRLSLDAGAHLDYGYAVTSHSSQGTTADRVLVHVDSEQAGEKLINSRLAYVAVSRARYDVQIYTNNAQSLGRDLSREVSHAAALEWNGTVKQSDPTNCVEQQPGHEHNFEESPSYGMER